MIDWRDRISITGQIIVSAVVIVGFIAVRILMIFVEILPSNQRSADTFDGALIGAFMGVIGFWIGSSTGSQKANATIAATARDAAVTVATVAAANGVKAADTSSVAADIAATAANTAATAANTSKGP